MGDTTSGQLNARLIPQVSVVDDERTLAQLVYDIGEPFFNRYSDEQEDDSVDVAGEIGSGSAAELAGELDNLMKQVGVKFAYWVQEDPKFEWMGDAHVYVPRVGSANFTCDADGNNRPDIDEIVAVVMSATTLSEAQQRVQELSAAEVITAWVRIRDGKPPITLDEVNELGIQAIDGDNLCDCGGGMPGVLAPQLPNGDGERAFIERCDNCGRFEDDDSAAKAFAERFGLAVHRRFDSPARQAWRVFVTRPGDSQDYDYYDTEEDE